MVSLVKPSSTPEQEMLWRDVMWEELKAHPQWPDLPAEVLRKRDIYGGAAGIWFDSTRTRLITPTGIAVSVLHTGHHYADDLEEDGIIYHYPTTNRHQSSDTNEIESVKMAQKLGIPIFVIIKNGQHRRVKRAYVTGSDDRSRLFLFEFAEQPPQVLAIELDHSTPFKAKVARNVSHAQVVRAERSSRFKFEVIQRYGSKCVLSGLSVVEMLDGAHVIPVSNGGSDDVRNGLLLSASIHRAFDAYLWAINPETMKIETRDKGPSLKQMKIEVPSLEGAIVLPHPETLEIRYELFRKAS